MAFPLSFNSKNLAAVLAYGSPESSKSSDSSESSSPRLEAVLVYGPLDSPESSKSSSPRKSPSEDLQEAFEKKQKGIISDLLKKNPNLFKNFLEDNIRKDLSGCFKVALLHPHPDQALVSFYQVAKKYALSLKESKIECTLILWVIEHKHLSVDEKKKVVQALSKEAPLVFTNSRSYYPLCEFFIAAFHKDGSEFSRLCQKYELTSQNILKEFMEFGSGTSFLPGSEEEKTYIRVASRLIKKICYVCEDKLSSKEELRDVLTSLLEQAIRKKLPLDLIKELVKSGADITFTKEDKNKFKKFYIAYPILEVALENEAAFCYLLHCFKERDQGKKLLLAYRNSATDSLLGAAIKVQMSLKAIKILIDEIGFDINPSPKDRDKMVFNTAPLFQACLYGNQEAMRLLLERGADATLKSEGYEASLLHLLIPDERSPHLPPQAHVCLKILLAFQVLPVDTTDRLGRTALHYACKRNQPECVKMLLTYGASPKVISKQKLTPPQVALVCESKAVIDYFVEEGYIQNEKKEHENLSNLKWHRDFL